ncbi:MAG: DUF5667 domain-containing protein [Candidatus Peregrinibacteria bacterium]|nr:DUF5667 domain-containing protein [Candidatus Peregrinibacteria bacterium]MDZ4244989.1 DUF5667 domain-containing protein [Candidatus Gracilibacteria bacterium]
MNFFKTDNGDDELKLEKGITNLASFGLPSKSVKKVMKSRLMSSINDQAELAQYEKMISPIRKLADSLQVPREVNMSMRRRLMNRISLDLGSFSWFDVCEKSIFGRASIATAMIIMISFVSIFTFQLNTPISYAKDSLLFNISGDVYVYRAGMLIPVVDGFVLQEGDKIHTGYGSGVTAIFMDRTMSRVDEESKLNLSKLYSDDFGNTEVTLGVAAGRIWSKVPSLIVGSFNVATLHTVVKVRRNATFDVDVDKEEQVAISVVENFVDVELSSYNPAVKTTVVEGESLIVSEGKNKIVSLDDKDLWLRMNMSKDEFEGQLLAQQGSSDLEDAVGFLPTDKLYGVKMFKENLGMVLGINQREKLENQLNIASKRLAEAEVLIQKGLSGNAEEVLKEYKQIMLDITHEYSDLIGIEDVERQLSAMMAQDKRRYYTTLPGSSLSDVKKVVGEVEFLLANDRVRANQIALNHASDDLYQVFNLLKHGGATMAEVSIEDYPNILQNTLRDLVAYNQHDQDGYFRAAFVTALSDLKTINALHEVVGFNGIINVESVQSRVIDTLDEYFVIANTDSSYDDLLAEFMVLQKDNLDELVELSEFVGVNDQNAATVDIALVGQTVVSDELDLSDTE